MNIKVFTAFSGYDSQCLALKYLGLDFDLVGWSEIDKYAIQAHDLLFSQYKDRNFGDISKIDWETVQDFDLFTYSFPCTDISIAGKQQGLTENSNTRSSLLWECRKAIQIKRPKYLLLENVKNLTSARFSPLLKKWLSELSNMGYSNYFKVLNAKDYGVPQNRERIFVVSILDNAVFYFPNKQKLTKRLKDVIEDNVADKYYLSERLINYFLEQNKKHAEKKNGFIFKPKSPLDIANTVIAHGPISSTDNYISKVVQIGNCLPDRKNFPNVQDGRIYSEIGIAPTLTTEKMPKILIVDKIRKITPKECFRLMGVREDDITTLLNSGISDRQLYKMAGNSIVVDVLMAIFDSLFINKTPKKNFQLKLF